MIRARPIAGFLPVKRSYAAFETALAGHPCASSVLGPDSTGRNLHLMTYGHAALPLFFITFSIHGSEWEPGETALEFTRRWIQDASPEFRWLRTHFRFAIVPVACPSGFDLTTYKNAPSQVNLNRNFDCHWSDAIFDVAPSNANYRGTAPFSELETQLIRDAVVALKPFLAVDIHSNTGSMGIDVGKVYTRWRRVLDEVQGGLEAAFPDETHTEWSVGLAPTATGWYGLQTSSQGLPVIPSLIEVNANATDKGSSYIMTALYFIARKAHLYLRKRRLFLRDAAVI